MKNSKLFRAWTLAVAIPFGIQSANAVVNIQNVGAGARSASFGNSYVAIADDADAVFEARARTPERPSRAAEAADGRKRRQQRGKQALQPCDEGLSKAGHHKPIAQNGWLGLIPWVRAVHD